MTAFYSICSWVLDPVDQTQVRRSAEAERDGHQRSAVTPHYEMLTYSDKVEKEAWRRVQRLAVSQQAQ
jgi:hypothetical protein